MKAPIWVGLGGDEICFWLPVGWILDWRSLDNQFNKSNNKNDNNKQETNKEKTIKAKTEPFKMYCAYL